MDKDYATLRLGGEEHAAKWIGVSLDVYKEWPERLHPVMRDRVYAAVVRRETARAIGQTARQFFADPRGEILIESMIERIAIASVLANLMDQVPPEFIRKDIAAAYDSKPRRKRITPKSAEPEGVQ